MWYLLPLHFLIHSFSLNMGLTLPDKTSWLANLSDLLPLFPALGLSYSAGLFILVQEI